MVLGTALVLLLCAAGHGWGETGAALRVGTSGDYPPFSMRDEHGALTGFDIDVARAFSADQGLAVEFVMFRWPDLQARLVAEAFDVVMSGITVRGDRLAVAPMTASVARADAVLLTRKGAAGTARDWSALMVGVNRGGHLEQVARAKLPAARIVPVDDNLRLPSLLLLGEVDAIVTDTLEVARYAVPGADNGGVSPFEIVQVLAHDRKAYWVTPKAGALVDRLDLWLARREADGWLDRLREHYFHQTPPSGPGRALERLTDLIGRRLMLMPAVAWAKQAAGRAVEDSVREAEIERAAVRAAREARLDEAAYLKLVRAQFVAARAAQRAASAATPTRAGQNPEEGLRDLVQVLRPAIERLDREILARLKALPPLEVSREDLVAALRADAPVAGLDDETLRPLAEAIMQVAATASTPPTPSLQRRGGVSGGQ